MGRYPCSNNWTVVGRTGRQRTFTDSYTHLITILMDIDDATGSHINYRTRCNSPKNHQKKGDMFFQKKPDQKLIPNSSARMKSQSAMEYLMTYGWAILIIAIVMIALFQLGIFNGTALEPRATAGACQVYKSAAGSSLAGQCNGEWPQFVGQFNGASSINVPPSGSLVPPEVTVSAWMMMTVLPGNNFDRIIKMGPVYPSENYYFEEEPTDTINFEANIVGTGLSGSPASSTLLTNVWYFIVGTYDGSHLRFYLNGVQQGSGTLITGTVISTPSTLTIGSSEGVYDGLIADAQIYNTSLSQSEITTLYQEGIGGAPIDPTHIVGWWPLNGNAQDYSGNNNQGTATAISYSSTWTSGYVQP